MSLLLSLIPSWYDNLRIWVRLTMASVLVAVIVRGSFLVWAARQQHEAAVRQAEQFAASVHQMTMAGLTGMMITGTVQQRGVFLEQYRGVGPRDVCAGLPG